MLVRAELVAEIGMLDEDYFLYYEDLDFSQRAEQAGFELLVVPSATITHEVSASVGDRSPESVYYQTRSRLRFISRYTTGRRRVRLILRYVLGRAWRGLSAYARGERALGRALVAAVRDHLLGRVGPRQIAKP